MNTITPGMQFTNNGMTVEVLRYHENEKHNVALLLCYDDGLFITVKDLTPEKELRCHWTWGHYILNKTEALNDYISRKKDL